MSCLMPRGRKGITAFALVTILLSIILAVVFLRACSAVADVIVGGSDAQPQFETFVEELKSLADGEAKETLLSLEEDMAVFGFTENGSEFRCYGCPPVISPTALFYFMRKPSTPSCEGSACVCLCSGLKAGEGTTPQATPLSCERLSCRQLSSDVASRIDLPPEDKEYPRWEGGFFFSRSSKISNQQYHQRNTKRLVTPFMEADFSDGKFIVAVCPELPCLGQQI